MKGAAKTKTDQSLRGAGETGAILLEFRQLSIHAHCLAWFLGHLTHDCGLLYANTIVQQHVNIAMQASHSTKSYVLDCHNMCAM